MGCLLVKKDGHPERAGCRDQVITKDLFIHAFFTIFYQESSVSVVTACWFGNLRTTSKKDDRLKR